MAAIDKHRNRRAAIENSTQLCSSTEAAAIENGRSRRGFSTAAASGGHPSCRTSQNFAAIGALLYDAQNKPVLEKKIKIIQLKSTFMKDVF